MTKVFGGRLFCSLFRTSFRIYVAFLNKGFRQTKLFEGVLTTYVGGIAVSYIIFALKKTTCF